MSTQAPRSIKARARRRLYAFINSKGEIEKFKSIKEFATRYGFGHSLARSLHCGYRVRLRGWCSTSSKPKAEKFRERFLTVLVNTRTNERSIVGPSVKKFANDHGLSLQGLSELVNGRVPIYRHWVLEKTLEAANLDSPDGDF